MQFQYFWRVLGVCLCVVIIFHFSFILSFPPSSPLSLSFPPLLHADSYLSEEEVLDRVNPFVQLVSGVVWLLRSGEVYINESMHAECADSQKTGTWVLSTALDWCNSSEPRELNFWDALKLSSVYLYDCTDHISYKGHTHTRLYVTGTFREFVDVISARTAVGHDAEGRLILFHIEGQTKTRGWE